jgi:hypothetical protein
MNSTVSRGELIRPVARVARRSGRDWKTGALERERERDAVACRRERDEMQAR